MVCSRCSHAFQSLGLELHYIFWRKRKPLRWCLLDVFFVIYFGWFSSSTVGSSLERTSCRFVFQKKSLENDEFAITAETTARLYHFSFLYLNEMPTPNIPLCNLIKTWLKHISIFPVFFRFNVFFVAWCLPHRSTQLPSNPSSVGVSQGRAARGRTLVVSRDLESALADRYGYDRRSWQMIISNGRSR